MLGISFNLSNYEHVKRVFFLRYFVLFDTEWFRSCSYNYDETYVFKLKSLFIDYSSILYLIIILKYCDVIITSENCRWRGSLRAFRNAARRKLMRCLLICGCHLARVRNDKIDWNSNGRSMSPDEIGSNSKHSGYLVGTVCLRSPSTYS